MTVRVQSVNNPSTFAWTAFGTGRIALTGKITAGGMFGSGIYR
jgi:hypothetical protein